MDDKSYAWESRRNQNIYFMILNILIKNLRTCNLKDHPFGEIIISTFFSAKSSFDD